MSDPKTQGYLHLNHRWVLMAIRQFRVKQLFTLLANTVAELSIHVIGDIFFYWRPYAVFISDFVAIGTDRQKSAKRPAHVFFK